MRFFDIESRRTRTPGFTLLELLVALLLLSLIFLLLTSGLQFGTKIWNSGEEPGNISEVVTVQQLLRRVLSEARPLMLESTPTVSRHIFFVGTENSVRFIAPMPGHLGVGGLYEVAIYLTDGGETGNRLEMSWRLFGQATGSAGAPEERRTVLVDKVANIQFAYFGYRGQQEPARWYNDWQGLQLLPIEIRMHVTFSEGSSVWPDLVVATMVNSLTPVIPEGEF